MSNYTAPDDGVMKIKKVVMMSFRRKQPTRKKNDYESIYRGEEFMCVFSSPVMVGAQKDATLSRAGEELGGELALPAGDDPVR
jgi:hypothetical protein